MPHDAPDLPEILCTVREFLDDLVTRLDGLDRYHALCSRQLLDVAGRELGEWRRTPGEDERRLAALVGGEPGDDAARERLCREIRAGRRDEELAALLEVLLEHVAAKARVARPDHLD